MASCGAAGPSVSRLIGADAPPIEQDLSLRRDFVAARRRTAGCDGDETLRHQMVQLQSLPGVEIAPRGSRDIDQNCDCLVTRLEITHGALLDSSAMQIRLSEMQRLRRNLVPAQHAGDTRSRSNFIDPKRRL